MGDRRRVEARGLIRATTGAQEGMMLVVVAWSRGSCADGRTEQTLAIPGRQNWEEFPLDWI